MRGFFREGTALANQFRGEEGYHDEEAEAVLYALESVSSPERTKALADSGQLINVNKMLVDIFHDKAPLLSKIPAIGKPIAAGIQSVDTIIKVSQNCHHVQLWLLIGCRCLLATSRLRCRWSLLNGPRKPRLSFQYR